MQRPSDGSEHVLLAHDDLPGFPDAQRDTNEIGSSEYRGDADMPVCWYDGENCYDFHAGQAEVHLQWKVGTVQSEKRRSTPEENVREAHADELYEQRGYVGAELWSVEKRDRRPA